MSKDTLTVKMGIRSTASGLTPHKSPSVRRGFVRIPTTGWGKGENQ
jgi:hypothetical protein